jgi:hypothetical protein
MAVFCIAVLFSYARRTQIDPSLHIITIDQTNLLKHSKRITIPFSNVESISLAYTGGKNRRRTIGFKLKSGKTEHATSYGISGISGEDLLQEVHRTMPDVPVIKPQGFWN